MKEEAETAGVSRRKYEGTGPESCAVQVAHATVRTLAFTLSKTEGHGAEEHDQSNIFLFPFFIGTGD